MNAHTPTPWDVMVDPRGRLVHVETSIDNPAGGGFPVCSIPAKREADADFIVLAANSHEALKSALRNLFDYAEQLELVVYVGADSDGEHAVVAEARAALALAETAP